MARIFWDTNLFIYLLEDHPTYGAAVEAVRRRMLERGDLLFTSALTVGEILVKPIASGRSDMEHLYASFFQRPGITVLPFDLAVARTYAQVRQDRTIRPPDAIQLACAATQQIDLFITNDDRLSQKVVPGVQFITGLERAPI
ncbi:MAG: type II toxin-antitoxin system VapC family toxin [Terriglobales bacterium]